MLHQDNHYTFELLPELGPWDVVFWLFCGLAHALVVTVILSPADLYAVLLASLLLFYFLGRICSPRGAQLSMTQENTNLLGYCAGLLVVTYNVPDSRTGREAALLVTILLDYLLGVGHTWDANPTMDVVTNCRRSLPPLLRVQRVPLPGGPLRGVGRRNELGYLMARWGLEMPKRPTCRPRPRPVRKLTGRSGNFRCPDESAPPRTAHPR